MRIINILKNLISPVCETEVLCGKKKSYIESKVLIGTMSKIGTGFDQSSACENYSGKRFNLLILTSSIKKESMLEQNVGRVFRDSNPIVYHLVDNDPIIISHWYIARKWYIKNGGIIE